MPVTLNQFESLTPAAPEPSSSLWDRYCTIRQQSLLLCEPLTPEDMMVQSCPEASPAKWHIAHTTWFFETFLLREFAPHYEPFHPDFLWLFNSYYNSVSDQPEKKLRASFARPALAAILDYRQHVDSAIERLLAHGAPAEAERRLILGLHHEQQHQELLLTDVKHAFWSNPLRPAYHPGALATSGKMTAQLRPQRWSEHAGGVCEIGASSEGFCFDNEEPRHRIFLEPFALATRPVSCAEYLQFMEDGGYTRPELWLSEGWQTVQEQRWQAPLYWHRSAAGSGAPGEWSIFTLHGEQSLQALLAAPVCHVSYFEADAFARWAGCRLPTEGEWEVCAARALDSQAGVPATTGFLEGDTLHPLASADHDGASPAQLFGGVWEWTGSAYLGYPGYKAVPGPLGEYNGKFMCNQMVLRGGSVATPASHIRATYRNFFPPATRWQFSGIRLARR